MIMRIKQLADNLLEALTLYVQQHHLS